MNCQTSTEKSTSGTATTVPDKPLPLIFASEVNAILREARGMGISKLKVEGLLEVEFDANVSLYLEQNRLVQNDLAVYDSLTQNRQERMPDRRVEEFSEQAGGIFLTDAQKADLAELELEQLAFENPVAFEEHLISEQLRS